MRPLGYNQNLMPINTNQPIDDDLDEILVMDASGKLQSQSVGLASKKSTQQAQPKTDPKPAPVVLNKPSVQPQTVPLVKPAAQTPKTESKPQSKAPLPLIDKLQQTIANDFDIDALAREVQSDLKHIRPSALKSVPTSKALAKPEPSTDYAKLTEDVIRDSAVVLKDAVLLNRLRSIVSTQLRGIRKLMDTRLILIRPSQLGGLGFDGTKADAIIETINLKMDKLGMPGAGGALTKKSPLDERSSLEYNRIKRSLVDSPVPAGMKPSESMPDVKTTADVSLPAAKTPPAKGAPRLESILKPVIQGQTSVKPAAPKSVAPNQNANLNSNLAPNPSQAVEASQDFSISVRNLTPKPGPQTRPLESDRITDIRSPYQLIGPVQELRYSIVDFRRISDNPAHAIAKIQEKVANLEREAFVKRIQGIRSWQSGEVFQTYLQLGLGALTQNVSIDEVIRGRESKKQATLSREEFEAVNKLSQLLEL